jgi:hypothetical protein
VFGEPERKAGSWLNDMVDWIAVKEVF